MKVHIIGGGVVGLCAAWYLQQAGFEVTVIDQSDMTDGASYGNAGMIVPSHVTPLAAPGVIAQGIRWMFDAKSPFYIKPRLNLELLQWLWQFYRSCTAKHVAQSMPVLRDYNVWSKNLYRELSQTPGFDFDLEEYGLLMLCRTERMLHEEAEVAAQAQAVGVDAKLLNASEVQEIESGIRVNVQGGVLYPGDAHFYSNKFMSQLHLNLQQVGVVFLSRQKVVGFNTKAGKISQILLENGNTMEIEQVVLAAGSWSAKVLKQLGIRLLMQDGKGYSITLQHPPLRPRYPTLLMESRVAVTPMGADLRIGGTLEISNLSPKINPRRLAGIIESIPAFYPDLQVDMPRQEDVWHGFRPCTPDGLPYMGRSQKYPNLVLANGHAMMGMSLGPASGKLVAEILQDKEPSIDLGLFTPERFASR